MILTNDTLQMIKMYFYFQLIKKYKNLEKYILFPTDMIEY